MQMSQDWLMRQIQVLAVSAAQLLFGRGSIEYKLDDENNLSVTDQLHKRLVALLAAHRLGEAEDLLFEQLDFTNRTYLVLAVDFYERLNALTDEELNAADFPRIEIDSGLYEVLRRFGIYLPGL